MNPSLRYKNLGAINGNNPWVRALPGFIGTHEITKGNHCAEFDTFENGVACWWELLRRYRARKPSVATVGGIIMAYGGAGQEEEYRQYAKFVVERSGLLRSTPVSLDNDRVLLALAKAMFCYEAGVSQWTQYGPSDAVLVNGFNIARKRSRASGASAGAPSSVPQAPQATQQGALGLIQRILGLARVLLGRLRGA